MKLYDLPPRPREPIALHGSHLEQGGVKKPVTIYYHNADGMYSRCTMEMDGKPFGEINIAMFAPIKKVKDKYYLEEER